METKDLRSATIRLAHEKPELRGQLLPLLQRTAGSVFGEGDIVEVRTRKGWVEATVVEVVRKRTGSVEIRLSSSIGDLRLPAKSDSYASNAAIIRYKGKKDPAALQEDQQSHSDRQNERDEAKADSVEAGQKGLEEFDPRPGDKILIGYSNGAKVETVNGVNWKTGKVGVVKPKRRTPEEEKELIQSFLLFNRLSGRNVRPPLERDTRWISGRHIVRVVERFDAKGAETFLGP